MRNMVKHLFTVLVVMGMVVAGFAPLSHASKGIGLLNSFEREVQLKSIGAWGTYLQQGLPIYSGDKFFTRNGTAKILFHDGSSLEVGPYSILRVVESETQTGRRLTQRDIRILLGKARYQKDPDTNVIVNFITPTSLAVLNGDEAVAAYFPDVSMPDDIGQSLLEGADVDARISEAQKHYQTLVYVTGGTIKLTGQNAKQVNSPQEIPDITYETAKKDVNFQFTLDAVQGWSNRKWSKRRLEEKNSTLASDVYEKHARTDHLLHEILAEDFEKAYKYVQDSFEERYEFLGSLGAATPRGCISENIIENISFSTTPHRSTAENAAHAAVRGKKDREILQGASKVIAEHKEKFRQVKEKLDQADTDNKKRVLLHLLVGLDQTISSHEKGIYRLALMNEANTIGSPTLKRDADMLIKFGDRVVPFEGNRFLDPLNTAVNEAMAMNGGMAGLASGRLYASLATDMLIAESNPQFQKKLILIQIIVSTISAYAGVNNILVNAHEESLADQGVSFAFEDMLMAIEAWVKEILDVYNKALNNFDGLDIDALLASLEAIEKKLEEVESTAQMHKNFIEDLIRTSAVLSGAVFGSEYKDLGQALAAWLAQESQAICGKCSVLTQIPLEPKCIDIPGDCMRCNPQGNLVPDNFEPCDDGDPCTKDDKCLGGRCRGTRILSDEDPRCK